MDATAVIYSIENTKGKEKTYLIRKVFGYKDFSNNGRYKYERPGILTPHILQKWGKSVIIIKRHSEKIVDTILEQHKIKNKKVRIILES